MGDWNSHPLNKAGHQRAQKPVPQKWPLGRDEKREEPRLTSILIQKSAMKEPEPEFRRKTAQRRAGGLLCHSRQCPQTGGRHASLLLENETRYEDRTWMEGREPVRVDCCWAATVCLLLFLLHTNKNVHAHPFSQQPLRQRL